MSAERLAGRQNFELDDFCKNNFYIWPPVGVYLCYMDYFYSVNVIFVV